MPQQYLYRISDSGIKRMRAFVDELAASEDRYYEFIDYDPRQNDRRGIGPSCPIELFREVIKSPIDAGPGSQFAECFSPYPWKALAQFATEPEHFDVLIYQVVLDDTWRVGFPNLILAGSKSKKNFLLRECRRLPADLREEAWLFRKLCYGHRLDEISWSVAFPLWLFKAHDSFLGCLMSDEAQSLKSSGFRYCDFVKSFYEKADNLDAQTSQYLVDHIEQLKESIRRASGRGGGMLIGVTL
jgi:hypothetical protein